MVDVVCDLRDASDHGQLGIFNLLMRLASGVFASGVDKAGQIPSKCVKAGVEST